MPSIVRAMLWILLVIAPGGVLLLPLLVGDAVVRRKRQAQASLPGVDTVDGVPAPLSGR